MLKSFISQILRIAATRIQAAFISVRAKTGKTLREYGAKQAMKIKPIIAAFLAAGLLTGCAQDLSNIASAFDFASVSHENAARIFCRVEAKISDYQDGVLTEKYGECMEEKGYLCTRNFAVDCSLGSCSDLYKDNFKCERFREISEEYKTCFDERFEDFEYPHEAVKFCAKWKL